MDDSHHLDDLRQIPGDGGLEPDQSAETSEHDQLEELLSLQREVLEAVALGEPFEQVLDNLCALIERAVPHSLATLMLLDKAGSVLNVQAGPSLSPEAMDKLNGLVPGHGAGSCGTAASCGKHVFVEDTLTDARWARLRDVAHELGIRSCWSIPILSEAKTILGTFAISSLRPRSPTPFHVRVLETASYLAGIAIQRRQREEALRDSEARLRNITDTVPGVVFQYRLDPHTGPSFTFVSRGAEELSGLPMAVLRQDFQQACSLIPTEDRDALREIILQAAEAPRPWHHEFRLKRDDGQIRWLSASAAPEAERQEDAVLWNGMVFDISERKRTEERLVQWATAFENTTEGVMITDAKANILDVNLAFCGITGYSRGEVKNRKPSLLRSGRHDASFYRSMWATLEATGRWQGEIWNRRKNGETYPEWLSVSQITNADGEVVNYVAVFADISRIKESERKLLHLAHHDPLTGLPNRLLFSARLEHALDQAHRSHRQIALLFLDLDRFKNVNDSLGHALGDELLVEAARRLRNCVRQQDTVARLGGDEFILILEDLTNSQDAGNVARKILQSLEQPFSLQGHDVVVTASVGISLYPTDGRDGDTLLRNADAAMYRAKDLGRNDYSYYTRELTAIVQERFALELSLRPALERGEFTLFYQGQVSAADGRVVGAEALLRWQHPRLGLVTPGKFIPVAEDTGLIKPIGEWVLRTACAQAKAWQDAGLPPVRLAANLSGQQITPEWLSGRLEQILEESGLSPAFLELEITESFVMQHPERSLTALDALKKLGIRLAIDDFGTGYSSLGYLKRLPVHTLKIDQSLVRDIPTDPNDEAIAKAVIALGHSMGLTVIAEGVETEMQRDFLRREGCDELQGYLYSRPVPADEFAGLLVNGLPTVPPA